TRNMVESGKYSRGSCDCKPGFHAQYFGGARLVSMARSLRLHGFHEGIKYSSAPIPESGAIGRASSDDGLEVPTPPPCPYRPIPFLLFCSWSNASGPCHAAHWVP